MANKIKLARGTKSRIESVKSTLVSNELIYSTDTDELGVKKTDGDVEYFSGRTQIDSIVGDIGGALDLILENSGSGGGITKKTMNIPFTEVMSETQTTIEVQYSYVGDDPVNYTADFSNFTLGNGLTLNMGSGAIPPTAVVQTVFGKTTLNYFEMIILFRYIITATLAKVITDSSDSAAGIATIMGRYTSSYVGSSPDIFKEISDVNINGATFTVDFMTQCQDIPFYNTVTGRGSDMSVAVESALDMAGEYLPGTVGDSHFGPAWESLGMGYTNYFYQIIGGMTLKLSPNIKMNPVYNGAVFVD